MIDSESCGIIEPPYVVSVSYGQDEGTATHRYAIRQCNEYGKLGLLGTTVLYSSGDHGVAGNNNVCQNSSGEHFRTATLQ
jgi:tripeptidyl-peptidase I